MNHSTLAGMLAAQPPAAPALQGLNRRDLSFAGCLSQMELTTASLRRFGVGPADRVAIVLPNGPELALCFLSIASAAVAAPLNPKYSETEFRFYLADLGARLLLTEPDLCPAAEQAAEGLGLPLLALRPSPDRPAGVFELEGSRLRGESPGDDCEAALLLHSSGTTARPKLIPLSQANLCTSAANVARSMHLTGSDVCLNVMPLFHIHGLVGALLSSLSAGAATFCSSGFDVFRFSRWRERSHASWTTAVPTMYQTLLSRPVEPEVDGQRFRALRSCSAPLHTPVWERLEQAFGCPVVNTYGMTEAAHQMAANPLPPGQRRLGTVGQAAGPRIAILGEEGRLVSAGQLGEIVIQGANVTSGYLSPESARATAFHDGWFRTGDQGFLDPDGFLTLTGRLKEIINVGGEKVAPAEIDEVLLGHPAVAQAVAFSVPSAALGETVYAAVVLQAEASEAVLRGYARERLARFKVPERFVFVESIPKGPTGKLQRIGLAERLGVV